MWLVLQTSRAAARRARGQFVRRPLQPERKLCWLRAIEDALVAHGQSEYDAVLRATESAWETSEGTKVPGLRPWAAVRQDQAGRLAQSAHRHACLLYTSPSPRD